MRESNLTLMERNSLTRGRKSISSLSHTCLALISILPRSFHRCRPYFIKILREQFWDEIHENTHYYRCYRVSFSI